MSYFAPGFSFGTLPAEMTHNLDSLCASLSNANSQNGTNFADELNNYNNLEAALTNFSFPPMTSNTNTNGSIPRNGSSSNLVNSTPAPTTTASTTNNILAASELAKSYNFNKRRDSVCSYASTASTSLTAGSTSTSLSCIPDELQNKCRELEGMLSQALQWKNTVEQHATSTNNGGVSGNNSGELKPLSLGPVPNNKFEQPQQIFAPENDSPSSLSLTSENLALFKRMQGTEKQVPVGFPSGINSRRESNASETLAAFQHSRLCSRRESNASMLSTATEELFTSQPQYLFNNLLSKLGSDCVPYSNLGPSNKKVTVSELTEMFYITKQDFFEMKLSMNRISDLVDYKQDSRSTQGTSIKSSVHILSEVLLKNNINDFNRFFNKFVTSAQQINVELPRLEIFGDRHPHSIGMHPPAQLLTNNSSQGASLSANTNNTNTNTSRSNQSKSVEQSNSTSNNNNNHNHNSSTSPVSGGGGNSTPTSSDMAKLSNSLNLALNHPNNMNSGMGFGFGPMGMGGMGMSDMNAMGMNMGMGMGPMGMNMGMGLNGLNMMNGMGMGMGGIGMGMGMMNGLGRLPDQFSATYTRKRKRKNEKPKDYDNMTWNFTLKKSSKKNTTPK